jgi:hypothetical protein
MPRNLTTRAAREMAAARKSYGGGRPKIPTRCPKCHVPCASARKAQAHC